jgi:hypothetical protein
MRVVAFIFLTLDDHKERHSQQNRWLERVQPLPERRPALTREQEYKLPPTEGELIRG